MEPGTPVFGADVDAGELGELLHLYPAGTEGLGGQGRVSA